MPEYLIGFQVHCINHSATAAYICHFNCEAFANEEIGKQLLINGRKQNQSLRAGFEPAREYPIGFQVQRLNHSAITAYTCAFYREVFTN